MAKKNDLIEALEKSGFLHPTIVKVKLTPEQRKRERYVERVVRNYVMRIEKGHKMAAHSTLHFKGSIRASEIISSALLFIAKKVVF